MKTCKRCNGKGYNTVYQGGEGGYTDFGPIVYINIKRSGIENVPCKTCNGTGKDTLTKKTRWQKIKYNLLQFHR